MTLGHYGAEFNSLRAFEDRVFNETSSEDPFVILYVKMARLAKKLRLWGQRRISTLRLQLQIAHEVILRLDVAQELRILIPAERSGFNLFNQHFARIFDTLSRI
uniref:Uncharacterized protein n=1 Tax=Oryza meridionalis TaxID=40149 RepID=A0A0E0FAU4_9ORYZ